MDNLKLKSWWASLGIGATSGPSVRDAGTDHTDFADMGTAFGLDASLRERGEAQTLPAAGDRLPLAEGGSSA